MADFLFNNVTWDELVPSFNKCSFAEREYDTNRMTRSRKIKDENIREIVVLSSIVFFLQLLFIEHGWLPVLCTFLLPLTDRINS